MVILSKESGVLLKKQRENSGGKNQTTLVKAAENREIRKISVVAFAHVARGKYNSRL